MENQDFMHYWIHRTSDIALQNLKIITRSDVIATIGSCFARQLANSMHSLGLKGTRHPVGMYNSSSIRQELARIFGEWEPGSQELYWQVDGRFVHPFKTYSESFASLDDLKLWSMEIDGKASTLFRQADFIVATLGLVEVWQGKITGNIYRGRPPRYVIDNDRVVFRRLAVSDILSDLVAIREILHRNTKAQLILTVSPVPLKATMMNYDIRVANAESKSRIRAAVSEFIEKYRDVYYFPSYEMVTSTGCMERFLMEDGRHITSEMVEYIVNQFIKSFVRD